MIFYQIIVYAFLAPGLFCLLPLDLSIFALYRLLIATIRKTIVCRIVIYFYVFLHNSYFVERVFPLFRHLCPLYFVFMRFSMVLYAPFALLIALKRSLVQ